MLTREANPESLTVASMVAEPTGLRDQESFQSESLRAEPFEQNRSSAPHHNG
jgi:hypothetical protein